MLVCICSDVRVKVVKEDLLFGLVSGSSRLLDSKQLQKPKNSEHLCICSSRVFSDKVVTQALKNIKKPNLGKLQ